jgi:voltage-gated sodium channel
VHTGASGETTDDPSSPKSNLEVATNVFANLPKTSSLDEEVYDVSDFYWRQGFAQAVARSEAFINVTLAVIALNAVYLGIDADHNHADLLLEADIGFITCEYLFAVFFVFEWAFRFAAFQDKLDCLKDNWFKFDSFLVLLMVMETWVMPFLLPVIASGSKPPPTAPLRLLRLLRLSRLVRLLRSLPDLIVIVKGMFAAMRAVSSSLLMILILIYVFAIVMHMFLAKDVLVEEYFATLPRCMWTLLMDGTLLSETGPLLGLLVHRGDFNCVVAVTCFLIFILLASFTVMNMLIGILCEVVAGVAESEKEEAAGRVMRQTILLELKKYDDGDGMIDEDELTELMADPMSLQVLESLGIDVPFLQEFQVMTYREPGSSFPMKMVMDQMLTCRRDLSCSVKHLVMQHKLSQWTLGNSIMQHEERMEKMQEKGKEVGI